MLKDKRPHGFISRGALGGAAAGAGAWMAALVAESVLGTDAVTSQLLQVLLSVGAGLLIYAAAARVMGLEELRWLRSALGWGAS